MPSLSVSSVFPRGEAPRLRAFVSIPRLDKVALVTFVVDTGAARTAIGYDDRVALGIEPATTFAGYAEMRGVGGTASYGVEDARVMFRATLDGEPTPLPMHVPVLVAEAPHDNASLLGRDLLYEFTLTMTDGQVGLELPLERLMGGVGSLGQ